MKKATALALILIMCLSIFGCKSMLSSDVPDAPAAPTEVLSAPFAAETIEYGGSLIISYGDYSYSNYADYGYGASYYFPEGTQLVGTGNTVAVEVWNTCGTGLPEDYDPYLYDSEVYKLANDTYNGFFIFIKDANTGVYYPMVDTQRSNVYSDETIVDHIDRIYGKGSTDTLTGVILMSNYDGSRYELPKELADKLIDAVKNSKAGSTDIGFQDIDIYDFNTTHTLCFKLENKLECPLPFMSDINYIAGMKIDKELTEAILGGINEQNLIITE